MILRKEIAELGPGDHEFYRMVWTAHANPIGSWRNHLMADAAERIAEIGVVEYLIH